MAEVKARTWRGKCRHVRWGQIGFAFNAPKDSVDVAKLDKQRTWDLEHDEMLELLHGFTTITQRCETCGKARSYRTAGRTQA
jgi:hypothetical protein